jgi:HlyD family secretion protein
VSSRVLSLAVGLAFLFLAGCRERESEFVVAAVEAGSIEANVSATGTVNPVHMVEVGTYASGRIDEIYVDYNSKVEKGDRIAKIDPSNARVRVLKSEAAVESARARVERAEADLRLKAEQLERHRALHEQSLETRDQFQLAETAHLQALAELSIQKASLAQSLAELEDSRVNLTYTDIISPIDGIVLSRNVNVGQTVAASFQTPTLFLIAQDLTAMQENADVSESDVGLLREGQLARFSVDAFPDLVFEGRVRQVRNAPVSVQNVVTYDVVIDVANPELVLRPGMTATITVITDHKADVLKVPLRALRFRPRGAKIPSISRDVGQAGLVWLASAQQPSALEVRTGLRDDEFVEVSADGLVAGTEIVIGYRRTEVGPR